MVATFDYNIWNEVMSTMLEPEEFLTQNIDNGTIAWALIL